MTIRDNGRGFSISAAQNKNGFGGYGIRNMQKRAKNLNAELKMKSDEKKGTELVLHCRFEF